MNESAKNLILAISGASGAILGIRALEVLKSTDIQTHLIISPAAHRTIAQETGWKIGDLRALADFTYEHGDIGAQIASGSFDTIGMLVIPCSIKSLSAIAHAYTADLLARAADVTLKEGRPLVLVVREAPLHLGHLNLMTQAAQSGAIIYPPMPAFYNHPANIDDLVNNIVGRVLQRLGIPNELYTRWGQTDT